MKSGSIYFFLNSANLICRGTDIFRSISEIPSRLRDNESTVRSLLQSKGMVMGKIIILPINYSSKELLNLF